MHFRVCGHLDMKVVTGLLSNKSHQIIGVGEFDRAHARGNITAQGNNPIYASCSVVLQQSRYFFRRVAAKGQVGRNP